MHLPLVFNLQKYSIHDGDGIRTTLFFKGCPLQCAWCHNPESQSFQKQLMFFQERCVGCGACKAACPVGCIGPAFAPDPNRCTACGACTNACAYNARAVVGEPKTVEELLHALERDRMFYEVSGGGVTLSGGEPMAQDPDFLEGLLRRLKRRGCNIAMDTCGYAPWESYERVLPYVDTFLFDLKAATPALHQQYVGRDNTLILENLRRLHTASAQLWLRIPVIGGVNDSDAEMQAMIQSAVARCPGVPVNLLPYHNTGRDKYERLGIPCVDHSFYKPDDARMATLQEMWQAAGFHPVEIGG